jgi:hypothetical protein
VKELTSLSAFHHSLAEHFSTLRNERREENKVDGIQRHVFALEYGLSKDDYEKMRTLLYETLTKGLPVGANWLPLIVVATETASLYKGTSYWPDFKEALGTDDNAIRNLVRAKCEKFAEIYDGPRPEGIFAAHFGIIAGPLANAIIPIDLQARLLNTLGSLPQEELAGFTPSLLGARVGLAVGSDDQASARYKQFVKKEDLVGFVSYAYINNDTAVLNDESTQFLSPEMYERIIQGLSAGELKKLTEMQAEQAKIRIKRRRKIRSTRPGTLASHKQFLSPQLISKFNQEEWSFEIRLPNLSGLTENNNQLKKELGNYRLHVDGCERPVEAGQILHHSDFWAKITTAPRPEEPLFYLEGGSENAVSLLNSSCELSPYPWLFKLSDDYNGKELKGKIVAPELKYLLILSSRLEDSLGEWLSRAEWIEPSPCNLPALQAYLVDVPSKLDELQCLKLNELGISVQTEVSISPVGLSPAIWEGDQFATWILDETPVLEVHCSASPDHYEVLVNGENKIPRTDWPQDSSNVYIKFGNLIKGSHEVEVFFYKGPKDAFVDDTFSITMVPPYEGANTRQAIRIFSSVADPSLGSIWSNAAQLEFSGPPGASVDATIVFNDCDENIIHETSKKCSLPFTKQKWAELLRHIKNSDHLLTSKYDDGFVVALSIRIDSPDFGYEILKFVRRYPTLEWECGPNDHNEQWVKLHVGPGVDPTEVLINRYTPLTADTPNPGFNAEPEEQLTYLNGALFHAEVDGDSEQIIISPPLLEQNLGLATSTDFFTNIDGEAQAEALNPFTYLLQLCSWWAKSSHCGLDAHDCAFQKRTTRALLSRLGDMHGQSGWSLVEEAGHKEGATVDSFCAALEEYQGVASPLIASVIAGKKLLHRSENAERCEIIRNVIDSSQKKVAGNVPVSPVIIKSLLKLASEPRSIEPLSVETENLAHLVQRNMWIWRATRTAVFLVHLQSLPIDLNTTYRGWQWK